MADGRLTSPPLDDRTWQDIVDQARSLIPSFAPEWTDHNPSDLGITLVELFAWIVEGMVYRLNRVPDRNFVEFLNLIGVTLDPATPATAMLTWTLAPGLAPTSVPRGSRAAVQQVGDEPALEFETDQDATILPTSLTHALVVAPGVIAPGQIGVKYRNVTRRLVGPPLESLELLVPANDLVTVGLGFDQAVTQPIVLEVRLREPLPAGLPPIGWQYSTGTAEPGTWTTIPTVTDGTQGLTRSGRVTLTLPATWGQQNPEDWTTVAPPPPDEVIDTGRFWIGLRLDPVAVPRRLVLEHVLFNHVPATNALTIGAPEPLGTSTGRPFQAFGLRNRPLFRTPASQDPYAHLVVEVREPSTTPGEFGPWTPWRRVEEFGAGAGQVYRLEPVLGVVELGSHDPVAAPEGHGSIPPVGSEVRAATYRYVAGGAGGNLPPSTITVPRTAIPGIIGVTNHGPAQGGSDQQSVEDAKRRGPEVLRNRYRAVTAEDYEYLAMESTTDVVKVRALEPRLFTAFDPIPAGSNQGDPWAFGGLNRSVGSVNVIVASAADLTVRSPQPTPELLREVRDYLTARRTVSAAVNVTGPLYLPIRVVLDVRVWSRAVALGLVPNPAQSNQYRDQLEARVRTYLHPIGGQGDGDGWEVGEHVTIAGLFEFLQPPTEIGFIQNISVVAQAPQYTPPTRPFPIAPAGVWVQLADYELVCSATSHQVLVTQI